MIEAFKEKSHEMREVINRLTGYRVDMMGGKEYKLINIYSDSIDDHLLFEEAPDGDLQLMETDFSLSWKSLIKRYLQEGNSLPAFLSAITLELYNRTTIMEQPPEDAMSSSPSSPIQSSEAEAEEEEDDYEEGVEGEIMEDEEGGRGEDEGNQMGADEEEEDEEHSDEMEDEEEGEDEEDYNIYEGLSDRDEEEEEDGNESDERDAARADDDDDDDELICLD